MKGDDDTPTPYAWEQTLSTGSRSYYHTDAAVAHSCHDDEPGETVIVWWEEDDA